MKVTQISVNNNWEISSHVLLQSIWELTTRWNFNTPIYQRTKISLGSNLVCSVSIQTKMVTSSLRIQIQRTFLVARIMNFSPLTIQDQHLATMTLDAEDGMRKFIKRNTNHCLIFTPTLTVSWVWLTAFLYGMMRITTMELTALTYILPLITMNSYPSIINQTKLVEMV